MKLGITGAAGLLGFHLRAHARATGLDDVVCADRETFATPGALAGFADGCDVIVHLAGMNRGEEKEVAAVNVALTTALTDALEETGSDPTVVFSSSTQIDLDNPYGESKRRCADLLRDWAGGSGGHFVNGVLPGVFGEGGRPYYNSVVATFCHQLAGGEDLTVHGDAPVELLHVQDAVAALLAAGMAGRDADLRIEGRATTVAALAGKLEAMHTSYAAHVIPDLDDGFDRDIFNTYRACLYPDHYPVPLVRHADDRGHFTETVRAHGRGQFSYSVTRPGVTRGNHFHCHKVERFIVVGGEAEIRLRRLFGDEVVVFRVSGSEPCYVDIPTFHTHNITNCGNEDLITLFWTNDLFDPAHPDTVMEVVT